MKPVLAITVGDCNGVGPEVVIRALRSTKVRHSIIPLLVGPQESFSYYARLYGIPFRPIRVSATLGTSALSHLWDSGHVPVLEPDGARALKPKPGLLSPFAARMAAQAISTAIEEREHHAHFTVGNAVKFKPLQVQDATRNRSVGQWGMV